MRREREGKNEEEKTANTKNNEKTEIKLLSFDAVSENQRCAAELVSLSLAEPAVRSDSNESLQSANTLFNVFRSG